MEDKFKRHGMFALIAFNVTVLVLMFYNIFFRSGLNLSQYTGAAFTAIFIGLIVGGITFGIAHWKDL